MKRITSLLLAGLLCLSITSLSAQTETDTTFRFTMNTIFANVDKSKVPFGILRDYAMEFTNLENFSGTAALADSNYVTPSILWDVYNTLLMGRIHTSASGFLKQDTLDNRWYSYRQPGRITLSGLYFNYSRFKDNAANNYITITNNRLFDKYINGVWQNPYQTETAFIISPSITIYSGTSFNILLPSSIWLTNNGAAISSISIDVGDGLGYRTLTPDANLPINYSGPGNKEWIYRATLTAGGFLYAHSRVTITGNAAN
jgi:hypothetical protein